MDHYVMREEYIHHSFKGSKQENVNYNFSNRNRAQLMFKEQFRFTDSFLKLNRNI